MKTIITLLLLLLIVGVSFFFFFRFINKKTEAATAGQHLSKDHYFEEKWLKILANILLVVNVLAVVAAFLYFLFYQTEEMMYSAEGEIIGSQTKEVVRPEGFLILLSGILIAFIIWTLLRVISNISTTLKEIKNKQVE